MKKPNKKQEHKKLQTPLQRNKRKALQHRKKTPTARTFKYSARCGKKRQKTLHNF